MKWNNATNAVYTEINNDINELCNSAILNTQATIYWNAFIKYSAGIDELSNSCIDI